MKSTWAFQDMDNAWHFKGKNEGLRVAIVVEVHGNEHGPRAGFYELKTRLQDRSLVVESGELWLVIGNPAAVALNSRFGPDDLDLNRQMTTDIRCATDELPTRVRARQLMELLDHVDVVLDCHETNMETLGSFLTTPVLPEQMQFEMALRCFDAKIVIVDPQQIFGKGKSCTVEEWVGRKPGKFGLCYEHGQVGTKTNRSSCDEMVNFLRVLDLLSGHPRSLQQPPDMYKLIDELEYVDGFEWAFRPFNLRRVVKGEILGYTLKTIKVMTEGILVYPKTPSLAEKEGILTYLAQPLKDADYHADRSEKLERQVEALTRRVQELEQWILDHTDDGK